MVALLHSAFLGEISLDACPLAKDPVPFFSVSTSIQTARLAGSQIKRPFSVSNNLLEKAGRHTHRPTRLLQRIVFAPVPEF